MTTPKWALSLARRVATDYGRHDAPMIYWNRASDGTTLGGCQPPDLDSNDPARRAGEIFIADGLDRQGQLYILLHELAHWLLPPQESHGYRFNQVAAELYRNHMPPFS